MTRRTAGTVWTIISLIVIGVLWGFGRNSGSRSTAAPPVQPATQAGNAAAPDDPAMSPDPEVRARSPVVEFFARAVDQHGQPVAGVSMKVRALNRIDGLWVTSDGYAAVTDHDGRFSIKSRKDEPPSVETVQPPMEYNYLGIWPSKAHQFRDKDGRPEGLDAEHPHELPFWKLSERLPPLARFQMNVSWPGEKGTCVLDAVKGVLQSPPKAFVRSDQNENAPENPDGDVKITVSRGPGDPDNWNAYDWEVTLEMPHGGLQEMPKGFPGYEIPEAGYAPKLTRAFHYKDANGQRNREWVTDATFPLFLKMRDGKWYAVSSVEIRSSVEDHIEVSWSGTVPVDGSRSVETGFGAGNAFERDGAFKAAMAYQPHPRGASIIPLPAPRSPTTQDIHLPPPPPNHLYGKVIDDRGQPAANVEMIIKLGEEPMVDGSRTIKSDQAGLLNVDKLEPNYLTLASMVTPGYLLPRPGEVKLYWAMPGGHDVGTTAEKPWVVTLWKARGAAQPIIDHWIQVDCPFDGSPKEIYLPPKTEGKDGKADLVIRVDRGKNEFGGLTEDWWFAVEAPGGGLVETKAELAYEAPAEGYQPRFRYDIKRSGPDWPGDQRKWFLVQLDGGKRYACVWLEARPYNMAYRDRGEIWMRYWINPTGSRSLDGDPKRTYPDYASYLKASGGQTGALTTQPKP